MNQSLGLNKLKRKASEDAIRNQRHCRMDIVPKPVPKSTIYSPSATNYQDIREKMGLEKEEFEVITRSIRKIALRMLQVSDPQCAQNKLNWAGFKTEVCEKHPVFNRFEDVWPLVAYIRRWSYWHSRPRPGFRQMLKGSPFDPHSEEDLIADGLQLEAEKNSDVASPATEEGQILPLSQTPVSVFGSSGLSSNTHGFGIYEPVGADQLFIPRPINEGELRNIHKTNLEDLREAMKLETGSFKAVTIVLKNLAQIHLRVDNPLSQQTREGWEAYKTEAVRLEPLLSGQYEGAWPLSVYTDRYLQGKFKALKDTRKHEPFKNRPPLEMTDDEELMYPPGTLATTSAAQNKTSSSEVREVQGCAYKLPPARPTVSPFTWSPAVFEDPSSQLTSPPSSLPSSTWNSPDKENLAPLATSPTSTALGITQPAFSQASIAPATAKTASVHVQQFLSSLSPMPLESKTIIQQFVDVGVFDEKTLKAFQKCTATQAEKLTAAIDLTPLERLSLYHYFESAHREPSIP